MPAAKADKWALAMTARTLREAHDALGALMPAPDASLNDQRDFHLASSAAYARVADVDRAHHHEAMYWANREREKATEITRKMGAKAKQRS